MGTEITPEGLELRWSEDYKLFLPGTIDKININTADQETLESLPGVGEKLSTAIIKYREENGLFHSVDEIVNVSGIGIKKLNQMKEFIIVE
ncbi:ComEA family DNA-binding protein [Anaerotignum sp.]|uniref:ComEA family DNA-binding protein n=1 Tax=Anaerotignum sp. TaxID=2039241 RepID=UPI0028B1FCBC|nr:ComEA family DNA-binding protein [Anaerotignum sp.]